MCLACAKRFREGLDRISNAGSRVARIGCGSGARKVKPRHHRLDEAAESAGSAGGEAVTERTR